MLKANVCLLAGLTTLALTAGACAVQTSSGEGEGTTAAVAPASAFNTRPASLEEAKTSIEAIEAALRANPNDASALAAQKALEPRLDELNHLVARVEPKAGHVVSFFQTGGGSIVVKEAQPRGEPSLLDGEMMKEPTLASLYRRLSGGSEAPAELVQADAHRVGTLQEALTPGLASSLPEPAPAARLGGISTDLGPGDWFNWQNNYCYKGGDFHSCQSNWWNGGSYNFNAKSSFFQIAPVAGGTFYVQFAYNGTPNFLDPVNQGGYYHWWAFSSWHTDGCPWLVACDPPTHYDIGNHAWTIVSASNKEFDWSTEFRWNCDWVDCENAL